jgi:hypothetical protein
MLTPRWYFNKNMHLKEVETEGVEVVSFRQVRNKQRTFIDAVHSFVFHRSQEIS